MMKRVVAMPPQAQSFAERQRDLRLHDNGFKGVLARNLFSLAGFVCAMGFLIKSSIPSDEKQTFLAFLTLSLLLLITSKEAARRITRG